MCKQVEKQIEKEYSLGLADEKARYRSENARDNILRFYKDNKEVCDRAYQYYKECDEHINDYVSEPNIIETRIFRSCLREKKILTLTANPVEQRVFIRWMARMYGKPLPTYTVGNYTYNVWSYEVAFGNQTGVSVIHVNAGETGGEAARRAIDATCKLFKPDCIIAVGVCYGFDRVKYTIGQTFLSDGVRAFQINFRDNGGDTNQYEAEIKGEGEPDHRLIRKIRDKLLYMNAPNILSDSQRPTYVRCLSGKFLSVDAVVSHHWVKEALLSQYKNVKPKPVGGEMEGTGILSSDMVYEKGYSRWLILKSVCDWGEMKNDLDTDQIVNDRIKNTMLAFAMTNTCSVFESIMDYLYEVRI